MFYDSKGHSEAQCLIDYQVGITFTPIDYCNTQLVLYCTTAVHTIKPFLTFNIQQAKFNFLDSGPLSLGLLHSKTPTKQLGYTLIILLTTIFDLRLRINYLRP